MKTSNAFFSDCKNGTTSLLLNMDNMCPTCNSSVTSSLKDKYVAYIGSTEGRPYMMVASDVE